MKILSENMKNGILPLTKQTLYQLQLKKFKLEVIVLILCPFCTSQLRYR